MLLGIKEDDVEIDEFPNQEDKDQNIFICPSSYFQLYCFVIKLGKPTCVIEQIEESGTINIGGYGLYSS